MFEDALPALALCGRLLLGGALLFAGIGYITNRSLLTDIMTARGVPQAGLVPWAGIVVQIVCGALLVSGLWTALAAAGLIGFVIIATVLFDNFWDHQGAKRVARINGFVANVALTSGFILAIAVSA
jgi:putative oxidoreductase